MINQHPKSYHRFPFLLLIVFCCIFLSSCFTGKLYHHSRVKVDATTKKVEQELVQEIPLQENTTIYKAEIHSNDSIVSSLNCPIVLKRELVNTKHSRPNIIPKSKLKITLGGRKVSKVKHGEPDVDFVTALIFFAIIVVPALALLISGFLLGLAGLMVGFWICWVLGFIGISLAAFLGIAFWASGVSDPSVWVILPTILYCLLFLMAIAFLIIVLI